MITRRSFLGGLAAASVGVPLAANAIGHADQRAAASMSLTLANESGRGPVWTYIVGTNLATGQQCRLSADGQLVAVSEADNGPDGYTDYAIPVEGGGTTLTLPQGMSGRIYLAIGEKLKFRVNPGNALAYPAGWVDTDPNYPILHDCAEFTFDAAGMHCNTTMVDMLCVPLAISLSGSQEQTAGRLKDGGRAAVFSALAGQDGFNGLVMEDLRVISPGHGLDTGRFSADYFAGAIDQVWSHYQSNTMTVTAGSKTFTGQVTGSQFVFDGGVQPFDKPSTRDVVFCDGALHAPNDGVTGPVAAALGAGFNRSVLTATGAQPLADAGQYYREAVTNHYSRIMHENTVDGKAYGFAFDDVCEHAPYIEDGAPTSMTVTITPF
ncbi:beta-1,3-glucanase family protein [Actinophytocola gossypii]|uniref:Twin-arginine translocation signal domain-containing protein n=1 Tax=Actinophytocola gossypii TaxID=2812003 RepID=A0ABT2J677_9PSEU|nr:beta-1,3-glucanase family protein [Actinophytocola gossypii]MCT2583276.1 twin-arginine translocation signal domain-containing protein [Actinophytocola gossypii]